MVFGDKGCRSKEAFSDHEAKWMCQQGNLKKQYEGKRF